MKNSYARISKYRIYVKGITPDALHRSSRTNKNTNGTNVTAEPLESVKVSYKWKNLRNETSLDMRKDTGKQCIFQLRKKQGERKTKITQTTKHLHLKNIKSQHVNAFSFSSGNKILTRRKAEAILCISLKRQIQRMEEVRWEDRLISTLAKKEVQIPLCLSRLCFSCAGWGLILARACSRWFIKIGPGNTRGPEEKHFAHA